MERLPDDGLSDLFGQAFRDDQGHTWHINICDETTRIFEERMAARRQRAIADARRLWKKARWIGRSYGEGDITLPEARRRCEILAHRPDPELDGKVNLLPDWFAERLTGQAFIDGKNSVRGGR